MPADHIAPDRAAPLPQPSTQVRPCVDRDSIYWSKTRWRIVQQRLAPFKTQYLVIDSFHDEIVAEYAQMSAAMAHRDRLEGRTVEPIAVPPAPPVPNYNVLPLSPDQDRARLPLRRMQDAEVQNAEGDRAGCEVRGARP